MPKDKKEKKVFVPTVIQVLREEKFKGGATRLRIVKWNVDGKEYPPKLERRDYAIKEDGSERMKRGGGLKKSDCLYLVSHWDEFEMFLN